MTCAGKTFSDIGRRLLQRRALSGQQVAADDSVFSNTSGGSIVSPGGGLSKTYRDLARAAFQPAYWQNNGWFRVDANGNAVRVAGPGTGYGMDELNFSLFFGLAVDAYERTLISDRSPFDTNTMSSDAQQGRDLFTGKANCIACHDGPLFSKAATFQGDSSFDRIENMPMATPVPAIYDNGFYNIGARPTFEDIGVGAQDPYGNPLSFTRQFIQSPTRDNIGADRFSIEPCNFEIPLFASNCSTLPTAQEAQSRRVAVDGAFKTPILRNVALTPPYFHNGGQKSLEEVVLFYNRGGDRRSVSPSGDTTGTGPLGQSTPITKEMGGSNAHPDVKPLGLATDERAQLVKFMQALTDDRVACHKAPFDHPSLTVANGQLPQDRNNDFNADDIPFAMRAVGAGGYSNCGAYFDQLNAGNLFISSPAFNAIK